MMDITFPLLDLPQDCLAQDNVSGGILAGYSGFPCRIKAAVFAYVIDGSIRAKMNLREYEVKQGDFVVVMPGTFIHVQEVSESIRVHFIGVSGSFVDRTNVLRPLHAYYDRILYNPVSRMSPELSRVFGEAVAMIGHASQLKQRTLSEQLIVNIIGSIVQFTTPLYSRQASSPQTDHNRADRVTEEYMALVMKNYTREHRVCYYAEQMHISSSYLCATVLKKTGSTALQVIDRAILTDAKAQLKSSTLPVKTIALSLGFGNVSFFSKFFRTRTGKTPIEYRKQ